MRTSYAKQRARDLQQLSLIPFAVFYTCLLNDLLQQAHTDLCVAVWIWDANLLSTSLHELVFAA